MKITYHLPTNPHVPLSQLPANRTIETVEVQWEVQDNDLVSLRLVFRNQQLSPEQAKAKDGRDPDRDLTAYRIASLLADLLLSLTGIEAIRPNQVVGQSPDVDPETPEEAAMLPLVVMRGSGGLSVSATVSLARALNPVAITSGEKYPIAIAHFARAQRSLDPFDQYEEYYQAIECFIPKTPPLPHNRPTLGDKSLSAQAVRVDNAFDPTHVMKLRELRNRIIHTQADLGHLSPHELDHIAEVRTHLEDIKRLATILIWNTPTPWQ